MQSGRIISVAVGRFEDIAGRGLRAVIEEDESLALVAADIEPEQLDVALAAHRPDVAILNFGSLASTSDLRRLHRLLPDTRLVVLANRPTALECRELLAYGATACLSKSTEARDVLHAIHLASRGMHVVPSLGAPGSPELLTPREAEVLELIQDGRSNAQIAAALHVGIETVRTHASHVYRKLQVSSRRELRV